MTDPQESALTIAAKGIRLTRASGGGLVLTLADGRSFADVQIVCAAPLSQPNRYISFLDSTDEEIYLLRDLSDLPPEDRALAEEELRMRYLTSVIRRVVSIRREAGTLYCETETDRGFRELVVQTSDDSVRWLSERSLLLIDVDGNRLVVPDISRLDKASARLLAESLG